MDRGEGPSQISMACSGKLVVDGILVDGVTCVVGSSVGYKLSNASIASRSASIHILGNNRCETRGMHTKLSNQRLQDVRLDPLDHLQMVPESDILPSVSDHAR